MASRQRQSNSCLRTCLFCHYRPTLLDCSFCANKIMMTTIAAAAAADDDDDDDDELDCSFAVSGS